MNSQDLLIYKCYISANLHSKDDNARNEAADACKRLASKIKDLKALENILKKTFAVFHGSDGKLTVVDHKISVLQVSLFILNIYVSIVYYFTDLSSFLGSW